MYIVHELVYNVSSKTIITVPAKKQNIIRTSNKEENEKEDGDQEKKGSHHFGFE